MLSLCVSFKLTFCFNFFNNLPLLILPENKLHKLVILKINNFSIMIKGQGTSIPLNYNLPQKISFWQEISTKSCLLRISKKMKDSLTLFLLGCLTASQLV
jgi:hypothetical protein